VRCSPPALGRRAPGPPAADNAAEFVSLAIQGTPCTQDTRFGVWFEPLLPRLCPLREEPEGIL